MDQAVDLNELQQRIQQERICVVFIKTEQCGVCDVVLDKTKSMLTRYPQISSILVNLQELPEVSGAYLVFTAPTILLFVEGKEVYRASRFVVFGELEKTLAGWHEAMKAGLSE